MSTRQNKISRLLQRELADIFQKLGKNLGHNLLITVTVVRISPDLSVAKVYLSVFPTEKQDDVLDLVEDNTNRIRYDLGNRIKNQVRKVPELKFFIDDSLDYVDNINNLLDS